MIYLSEKIWGSLPIPDYRGRFFIESFWEYISNSTPHFYQARLMNVISSANEVIGAICDYKENNQNLKTLKNAIQEFEKCFSTDIVASEVFSNQKNSVHRIIKTCLCDSPSKTDLHRLNVICDSILRKKDEYTKLLQSTLRESVLGVVDLKQKDRNLSKIHDITGLYITNLLNDGYSPTYLYNRMEMFTRFNNYKGRSFAEQFNIVTESLITRERKYKIIYAVKTSNVSALNNLDKLYEVNVSNTIPVVTDINESKKLKISFEPNLFFVVELMSNDYVSASWRAKEKIDKYVDFALANYPKMKISISEYCLSVHKVKGFTHKHTVSISLLIKFLTSNSTFFNQGDLDGKSSKLLTSVLDGKSVDHFSRSLRHLRLGREATALEQKLLNIWISLESLFIETDKTIINSVLEYIPLIYAVKGIKSRIVYLLKLLSKYKIEIPAELQKQYDLKCITFNEDFCADKFFTIIKDEKSALSIFESINYKEHLKFRIYHIFNEIKDSEAVFARITKTIEDVKRQIRRIYYYRNCIVHTGSFDNIRPQLINHLYDYLSVCYQAVFESLSSLESQTNLSLLDLLVCYRLGAEEVFYNFKDKPDGYDLSDLEINKIC